MIVKPGFKVETKFGSESATESEVKFVEENGHYYFTDGAKHMEIQLKDGLLVLYPNAGDDNYAVLRKQKAK